MKQNNKIIIFVSILLITFILFSEGVIAPVIPNDLEHLFDPSSTYPGSINNLKELHLQISIVNNGIAESIIVVDTSNSSYLALAQNIQNKISSLTNVVVPIKDDNQITEQDYSKNLILIGNYFTNNIIKKDVYLKRRQLVDIDRPTVNMNGYLINRVRINSPQGVFTNAIVLSAQNINMVNSSVQYFINNILPQSPTNTIILDEEANYWYNAGSTGVIPVYDSVNPASLAYNAHRYWQTGDADFARAFYDIVSNIGWLTSDLQHSFNPDPNNYHQPGWFPAQGTSNAKYWAGGPEELGDNGGALDFNVYYAITSWGNMESSVMDRGIFTQEERLYTTQVLNYLAQMLYDFEWVHVNFENFIPYSGEPTGNHETAAARGLMAAGQYFGMDGYSYNQANATIYTPWPDNNAYVWMIDADNAFSPYITLSYTNDDAGGYWYGTPEYAREYIRRTNKTNVLDYFNNSGGMFGYGTDKSVADFYIMIQPNSPRQAGFGDVAGFKGHDYDPYALRFWAEQYNDGSYLWLFNKMVATGNVPEHQGGTDLPCPLLFGLGPQPSETEPTGYTGIKIAPLENQLYNYLNSYNGQSVPGYPAGTYVYGQVYFGYLPSEVHVSQEEAFNKITLRTSFNQQDQFMLVEGIGKLGHGHDDALAIIEFWDNSRLFLMDHSWDDNTKYYHNALEVIKDNEVANPSSSAVAAVKDVASFDQTGFLHMDLPNYGSYTGYGIQPNEWSTNLSRTIFWKKEKFFFVLDEVQANEGSDGNYELTLNWRSLGEFSGEGTNTINVNQQGEHFVVKTPNADYAIYEDYSNQGTWSNQFYPYAQSNQNGTLRTIFNYNLKSSSNERCCSVTCEQCNTIVSCSSYGNRDECEYNECNIGPCAWTGYSCVYTSGNVEICNNNIDDDQDNLIDCQDPDCYGQLGPSGTKCCSNPSHCNQDSCVIESCINNQCQYTNRNQCDSTECLANSYCDAAGGNCLSPNTNSQLGENVCEVCVPVSSQHNFGENWLFEAQTTPFCCNNDANEYYINNGIGNMACCNSVLENCVDQLGICRTQWGQELTCDDNIDNDCDGWIDIQDTDCGAVCTFGQTRTCPLTQGVCNNVIETCLNGQWPGCDYGQNYEQNTELTCSDNLDNDCDGLVDCLDPDCEDNNDCTTCENLNGYICEENQYCNGQLLQASNSDMCCSVPCSEAGLCSECGGLFGFGCTREECYNIIENCYFLNNFIFPNDCNTCLNAVCSSYSQDQQTCTDDPCDLGNCEWSNNACATIPCANGQTQNCNLQQGVCQGSMQTCTNNAWPGCDTTLYFAFNSSYQETESNCIDDFDNDCDSYIDCDDPDCVSNTACISSPGPGPGGGGGGSGGGSGGSGSSSNQQPSTPSDNEPIQPDTETQYENTNLNLYTIDFSDDDLIEIELEKKSYLLKTDENNYTLIIKEINENNVNLEIDSQTVILDLNSKKEFDLGSNKVLYITLLGINDNRDKANIRFEISEKETPKAEETPKKTTRGGLITKSSILFILSIIFTALLILLIIYLTKNKKREYDEEELRNVVQDALKKGYSKEEIKKKFLENGWSEKIIDKILKNLK